jgi:ornithine cyclodeaminase/alanine dehydrogenase-like protein (mu-crystallin family)
MRILGASDVERLLSMPACIDVMTEALVTLERGGAVLPLRLIMLLPDGLGAFGAMPSYLKPPDAIGLKAITVFPRNEGTAYDSHQGVVLVFETEHGTLTGIVDASSITAIRTAAVSGVATRLLAREDARTLALIGSGVQAHTHLDAMLAVRPIGTVRVWSRSTANLERFATAARARHGVTIEMASSARAAVAGADIVCTVTSSRTPVLERAWLAAGAHVNAVGASLKTARELDSDTVAAARLFVDRRESTLAESGDFLVPKAEGRIGDDHIVAELGELLTGSADGRRSPAELTVFKSLGLAVEDLAAAHYVLQRAEAEGTGTVIGGAG